MKPVSFAEFDGIYQDVVDFAISVWKPEMQRELAVHCSPWEQNRYDFEIYLRRSVVRYYPAYTSAVQISSTGLQRCEVGGFLGVFPMTMARLGFDVTMTETCSYYDDLFLNYYNTVEKQGVRIIDYDPFSPNSEINEKFDFASVMCLLEQYPHSLKTAMGNIVSLLKPGGIVHIEVPNIAYFPKRVAFLGGRSPLVPIEDIYRSEIPYIGHHHEFTLSELRKLASLADLEILSELSYNCSIDTGTIGYMLKRPVEWLAYSLAPATRECLAITCRRGAEVT